MKKSTKILKEIDNELFNQTDIDFIDEKIELNMPLLIGYNQYMEIDNKLEEINLKLSSTLDKSQQKLFNKYQEYSINATSYQNCLAYYIGIQTALQSQNLK